ncbi:MAG: VCBS repeat-containing protein [Bacteroidota bacterium]
MNGDGKPDVVTSAAGGVGIYQNITPDGVINTSSFLPLVPVEAATGADEVDLFDVDVDGRPDIISNNAHQGKYLNQ